VAEIGYGIERLPEGRRKETRLGLPIDGFDAQIAAICRARGAALATRKVADFDKTGVEVINPWDPGN
jgi:toxin FitB